jgi:transcriptional regulator with XRE-family HTH domain
LSTNGTSAADHRQLGAALTSQVIAARRAATILGGMSQIRAVARRQRAQPAVGALVQHWRKARHLSQLALAAEAEISPRHLCFVETGRARPSREMILLLASALDVPLRERNAMLLAGGFAPVYSERGLDAPELAAVRGALDAILEQQEPFPAVVMNRRWDIVASNRAAPRFFGFLLGAGAAPDPQPNVLRMMLGPGAMRSYVANWDAVAQALVRRVHREALGGVANEETAKLLAEILAYPGVSESWSRAERELSVMPIVPVTFHKGRHVFSFFSTVTTLGTPQDITAQELRIECFFPLDTDTATAARRLAGVARPR